jgi:trehalose 6-phosphate phosphatase
VLILGSYGIELPPELIEEGAPTIVDVTAAQAGLIAARPVLESALPPGARLEVKPFGLVLHYRGAGPEFDETAARELLSRMAGEFDLELERGRRVLELKPKQTGDKGGALTTLAERVEGSAAVYVGDDLGDIPAWKAVRALRVPGLAVGLASAELPAHALTECDLVLSDRNQLGPFLDAIIDAATAV